MNPQQELFNALSTDAAVLSKVDGDLTKISAAFPDKDMFTNASISENFPRITYVLDDRRHSFYVDNEPIMDELQFSVDIWLPMTLLAERSLNEIRVEIDRVLMTIGYRKVSESEVQIIDKKISHLSVSYSKEFPSKL